MAEQQRDNLSQKPQASGIPGGLNKDAAGKADQKKPGNWDNKTAGVDKDVNRNRS